jgi:FkbM family methyltransferase
MKFLFVAKQEKNAAAFLEALRCLVERGHDVTLSIQERDEQRDLRLASRIPSTRFRVAPCPPSRIDEWARVAPLIRRLRDAAHYLRPPFVESSALHERIFHKLRQELGIEVDASVLAAAARALPEPQLVTIETILRLAEHQLPTSSLFDEYLSEHRPDVLLVSPLVHFGSAQADVAASARRLGIPVWMLLFSWDNLSTKGCLHVAPDLMFVWNERQRVEAVQFHGVDPAHVVVVGAPRFDRFFALRPIMSREAFHEPLGLDPSRPTLLYVCSSRLIAPDELPFVRRWIAAVRRASNPQLARCNIVVRPHPDIDLLPKPMLMRHQWPAAPNIDAHIGRPFDDDSAVVVRTSFKDQEGLYESLVHSTAVIGMNTTAELEAAIVGRPVFTIEPGEAGGQQKTVHFAYLTREEGGIVLTASNLDEHVSQLAATVAHGVDLSSIRAFVQSFLRPLGIDRAVSPLLADALEQHAAAGDAAPAAARAPAATAGAAEVVCGAVLPLAYPKAQILVHATPEAVRHEVDGSIPLNGSTVRWIEESVGIGEVVYDINASFGTYTLLAARQRGATVVAFEPGYRVYAALCDNLLLNGCQGAVIPLPIALADADGLRDMKYQRRYPGNERYAIQDNTWRVRPPEALPSYIQPVCTTALDIVTDRYQLPPAAHLRVSPRVSPFAVLSGAARTLRQPELRTIWLKVAPDRQAEIQDILRGAGFSGDVRRRSDHSIEMVFRREPAAGRTSQAEPGVALRT